MGTRCITSNSTHIILEWSITLYRFFNVYILNIRFLNQQNTTTTKIGIPDNAAKIKLLQYISIIDFNLTLRDIQVRHRGFTNS